MSLDDLLFLSAVMDKLNASRNESYIDISFKTDTVRLMAVMPDNTKLESSFDISLCKDYYNHVDKFINEVL